MLEHHRGGPGRGTASYGRAPRDRGPDHWNPAAARTAVREAVAAGSWQPGTEGQTALTDALLVTSELVTNAMLHGDGVTDFGVAVRGHDLYLTVGDRSSRVPAAVSRTDERGRRRCGGYGWPIVRRLCREVHVATLPQGGKRITAVIPLDG